MYQMKMIRQSKPQGKNWLVKKNDQDYIADCLDCFDRCSSFDELPILTHSVNAIFLADWYPLLLFVLAKKQNKRK